MIEVSVIIPNFNGRKYLKSCLESILIQNFKSFDIIVVDNGSQDGSVEYLKKEFPEVKVVSLLENLGFSGAVNRGIKITSAKYVVLLNNDTIAEQGFIKALVDDISSNPQIFSCQAKMIQMYDKKKIDDAGNYYCALGWAYAYGKGKPEKKYCVGKKIFSACAGAAIYRTDVLKKIGYFDEEHFAYLEDLDVGYRARLYGYENWFCPTARVYHVGSGTSGSRYNLFKVRYSSRNNIYMIYKNMPLCQIVWNLPLLIIGFGMKIIFFTCRGFGKEYIAGIKNGIDISKDNMDKKKFLCKIERIKFFQIQLELYKNILNKFF